MEDGTTNAIRNEQQLQRRRHPGTSTAVIMQASAPHSIPQMQLLGRALSDRLTSTFQG